MAATARVLLDAERQRVPDGADLGDVADSGLWQLPGLWFSAEELRTFPYIAVGLYLSAIAMACHTGRFHMYEGHGAPLAAKGPDGVGEPGPDVPRVPVAGLAGPEAHVDGGAGGRVAVDELLRSQEVPLNYLLNVLLRIAPASLRRSGCARHR